MFARCDAKCLCFLVTDGAALYVQTEVNNDYKVFALSFLLIIIRASLQDKTSPAQKLMTRGNLLDQQKFNFWMFALTIMLLTQVFLFGFC